jgi:hypothetical protein
VDRGPDFDIRIVFCFFTLRALAGLVLAFLAVPNFFEPGNGDSLDYIPMEKAPKRSCLLQFTKTQREMVKEE